MDVSSPPVVERRQPVVGGLGLVVLDEQMFVDTHPTVDAKVFATSIRTQIGGPVPTALAQLQRFGIATRFYGIWGADPAGQAIEDGLSDAGIEFDGAACRNAFATGKAHIWIETATGRRTVVSFPPAGQLSSLLAADFARSGRVLHLDGWGDSAPLAAAKAARSEQILVTFDCGSAKPSTEQLLPLANVVNVPRRFLHEYCGTSDTESGAKTILDLGPQLVTVTDGEQGAGIYTRDFGLWRPAYRVQAVDTCGAGDVFCGGLIYALVAGYEPDATLEFAMATAALKITRSGNRGALADYDEVVSFLERC